MRNEGLRPYTAPQPVAQAPNGAPPRFVPEDLRQVVQRQVALYTGMESSSVPEETALELLASVRFCVQVAAEEQGACEGDSLATWLLAGQRVLYARQQQAQRLQAAAQAASLPLDNAPYQDALAETRRFFTWYDLRFFAHQIPCMLDYPLALPVADEKQGVDYIHAWLYRRLWEDALCGSFPLDEVLAVLDFSNASWRQLPLNLYEPVLACALGGVLLAGDVDSLRITSGKQDALWRQLAACGAEALQTRLEKAAGQLCNRLRIWGSGQRGYYAACAAALAPRILAADRQGFSRIFLST